MKDAADFFSSFRDFALAFGELLGVLLAGIGIGAWGILRKKKTMWSPQKERRFVEAHTQIHEMLTELRVTVRACRCLIFQFHNGGSFADGTSIKRFSVTHESCATPAQSMILESQDVLLTRYMDIVPIMEERAGKIIQVDTLQPSAFRSGLEINSVEYFSVVPLKCMDGLTPMGFLCCHWCSADSLDEIEKEGITQQSLEQLIEDSTQNINAYLSYNQGKK